MEANRKRLDPILKQARSQKIKATLTADKLTVEGKMYTVDDLRSLPENLRPSHTAVQAESRTLLRLFVNFWRLKIECDHYGFFCDFSSLSGDVKASAIIMGSFWNSFFYKFKVVLKETQFAYVI